jgi:hypothetical protein
VVLKHKESIATVAGKRPHRVTDKQNKKRFSITKVGNNDGYCLPVKHFPHSYISCIAMILNSKNKVMEAVKRSASTPGKPD